MSFGLLIFAIDSSSTAQRHRYDWQNEFNHFNNFYIEEFTVFKKEYDKRLKEQDINQQEFLLNLKDKIELRFNNHIHQYYNGKIRKD